ncbi:MAG: right-handed parallel beta-helix repeat-containing protein [Vicinamibacteria bacterium]
MTRRSTGLREPAASLLFGLLFACGGADGAAAARGAQEAPSASPSAAATVAGAASWAAPIGVPAPSFGVAEEAPPPPEPWSSAATSRGFAFYYVCPSCPGAIDLLNSHGHPGHPRASIPSEVAGPAVVVLDGAFDAKVAFTANGSAGEPVFLTSRDPSQPARLRSLSVERGSFLIIERLWIGPRDAGDDDFGFYVAEGASHVALRRSELAGNSHRAGGVVVGSWGYRGAGSASQIVIDGNHVHDLGDVASADDQDAHCVTLNGSSDHVWVTHNRLERCSGDAIQVEAQRGRRASIHHVYYGANTASANRQSGGWVKNATDVIFSQNVVHDFAASSGGPGSCFGFQYDAEYVWFLFNEGYRCSIGINIAGADDDPGQYAYVIGNVLHDIHAPTTNPYQSGAMVIRGGTNVFVVNNTMYDVDSGVNMPPGTPNVYYTNNIIASRRQPGTYDLYVEGRTRVDARNNIFGANARFSEGGGTRAYLGDPKLVSPATGDFRPQPGSPAVDAGIPSAAYEAFQSRYGLSLAVDHAGRPRPAGAAWDIGAFELTPSAATGAR